MDPKLSGSAVPVELQLAQDPSDAAAGAKTIRTLLDSESRYRSAGAEHSRLIVPGDSQAGTLLARMGGAGGKLSPAESIKAMRSVIAKLRPDDSGRFLNYTGKPYPW